MKDYIVLSAPTPGELQKLVVEKLQAGWELVGGVSVSITGFSSPSMFSVSGTHAHHSNAVYAQAVAKR